MKNFWLSQNRIQMTKSIYLVMMSMLNIKFPIFLDESTFTKTI